MPGLFKFQLSSKIHLFYFSFYSLSGAPRVVDFLSFLFFISSELIQGFLDISVVKNPLASAEYTGGGNGSPLQYSCLENPMDRRVWWAIAHRVTESNATEQLNMQAELIHIRILEVYPARWLPSHLLWWQVRFSIILSLAL